ncbi:MAG: RNA 2',3'-cyclic phosphodiesterase [Rhodospirillales bacterium]|nr:RNA 2',3'-cyclic phosphodiesterase [Rhodospirillales bacterium]
MRTFVGLALPQPVRDRLALLCTGVEGARWISKENFHLTLHFIGEVDLDMAEEINANLSRIDFPTFELSLNGVGFFGKPEKPRAVWVGTEINPSLNDLQERIGNSLRRAGVHLEGRKFKPHITLARFKHVKHPGLEAFIQRNLIFQMDPLTIDNFVLFRSHLGHTGAHYEPLAEYPLQAIRN